MIEEIDSDAFIRHYFQKALGELDGNPQRFLEAAVAFVRQETDFFKHPGAEAAALGQLLAPKAEPAQPQPPAALVSSWPCWVARTGPSLPCSAVLECQCQSQS